ncbi:D-serine deaminase, pyridoxal phosphate-dependent [Amycolatopsis sacchari]|uniref:D-serine deaminase, pyridoxal phosphate-dependent n=1 Tax=Amycolatopsis sacchari TaxID=115433 RepID=A0A1I3ZAZ3_9PSEU|nr:amino acid deaminase [Amycolatopsis sacchari]SFK41264.1 D-serine deaminase, pyridoxal phosphate-dependent [Amycolatopsis sacchari]
MTSSDCSLDPAALTALRDEPLDWRFKAIPPALWGLSLGQAAKQRLHLFDDGFVAPVVVLEADALEHNLRTMADWCAGHGVRLAPHGKTTMAPQLFARQLELGAWGMTAANASQLRVYRAFGVSRVLLANQLVDAAALRWLAAELERDPGFEFSCWVDSVRSVELMTEALAGAKRPVDVLVELGGDGGRTGARDEATALAIAEAVRESPSLRLIGVSGYEGALAHDSSTHSRQIVAAYLRRLKALTITLAERGFFDGTIVVTAGGSAYFDLVADELTGWPDGLDVVPVLRSGAYVTHDDGFYRSISPLHDRFRSALRAWAQVTSKPTDDLALLTLGKRDASFDEGLPEPQFLRHDGKTEPLDGHAITAMNDQHSFLSLPAGSPVRVGDWIGLGLSHPCTVFDKWQLIPVVDGETVVDLVRTYF